MDERKGNIAYDLSGYGNHGTRYGASWYRGKIGYCLSFDGVDDYVRVADSPSLKTPTGLTVEVWIYPAFENVEKTFIAYDEGWGTPFSLSKDTINRFKLHIRIGDIDSYPNGGQLPKDSWSHTVVTWDKTSGNLILYVNTQIVWSGTGFTGDLAITTEPMCIGTMLGPEAYFNGLIDEVRIYNRALSPDEIKAHYWYGIIPSLRVPLVAVR